MKPLQIALRTHGAPHRKWPRLVKRNPQRPVAAALYETLNADSRPYSRPELSGGCNNDTATILVSSHKMAGLHAPQRPEILPLDAAVIFPALSVR